MKWDKTSVLEWLIARPGHPITIRMQGTTLRVQGVAIGVGKLDACSTEIEETDLDVGDKNLDITLTIHDNTLGIHLLATDQKGKKTTISMPISIPYSLLALTTPEEEAAKGRSMGEKAEPEFWPYELLR